MADDPLKVPLGPPPAAQQQGMRIPIRSEGMTSFYANFFRVTGTFEELIMDFGLHTGLVTPGGPEAIELTHRVVMGYPAAKRLLETLARSVIQHEQLLGPIETDPQKRLRQQQPQPQG
jgi:hypothetical protein